MTTQVSPTNSGRLLGSYGKLPLSFEANQGQTDSRVRFLSHGNGYTLFLTPSEAVLALQKPAGSPGKRAEGPLAALKTARAKALAAGATPEIKQQVLRIKLVRANLAPQVEGLEELPGKSNYFIGNDPKKWRINVPTYAKVRYQEIYPGVDLVYYGNQRQLESDFVIAPSAKPSAISLEIQGAENLSINRQGDLVVSSSAGEARLEKPLAYQDVDGARKQVLAEYRLEGKHRVGFELGSYDRGKPLVIDPVLAYSTYLGGSSFAEGLGIAVDSSGNAYVTGVTTSIDFPGASSSSIQSAFGGGFEDAFVAKLNATGTALLYSTYLGGSDSDRGVGIAVDSSGNAYVTGATSSTNFPVVSPIQSALSGFEDTFVAKLNADGTALVYSTYLGGSGDDEGRGIAVDSSGNAYVTGDTESTNFPVVSPIQSAFGGGFNDAFVAKLNATGTALLYSTYLGGSGEDEGHGIAVDSFGNAYVTGLTRSTNFPVVSPIQSAFGGGFNDAFVAKLNATGTALLYSTYLGGTGDDEGRGIAVDSSGNAYVTGATSSTNFPVVSPIQSALSGGDDAFVAKLNAAGTALVYSTYLGGSIGGEGRGIAVDSSGNAYVTGDTNSTDFPVVSPIQSARGGGGDDAFVAKLNAAGTALLYSTYLGGSGIDEGHGIAVDSSGNAYVTGLTESTNFPVVSPIQSALSGSDDAFVAKISTVSPDFSLSPISPVTVSVGGSASSSVTVNSLNGFNSMVDLSVSGAPAGVLASLNPTMVTPPSGGSASSTLTVSLAPFVTPSRFTLTVTGTSGSLTHSTTVSVTVTADPSNITKVIGDLLAAGCIDNSGVANALTSKLAAAQAAISAGNIQTAINILTALKNQLQAQSGKHIATSCTIGGVTFNPDTVLLTDVQSLIDSLTTSITPRRHRRHLPGKVRG